jgi:DNA-binding CsgD family transcriptional regulator
MTQNDTFRHRFSRLTSLSPEQEQAITLLLTGATDVSIATRLKIGRSTLYRWQRSHAGFIAELNRRRQALRAAGIDAVRSLIPDAIHAIRSELSMCKGHLALALLDKAGMFGTRASGPLLYADIGPTDAVAVLDEEVRRRRADGRLPAPTAPSTTAATDGTTNETTGASASASTQPAPAPEPPITDAERDLVLAELLADLDVPPDPPPTLDPSRPVAVATNGAGVSNGANGTHDAGGANGANGPAVSTGSMSSMR